MKEEIEHFKNQQTKNKNSLEKQMEYKKRLQQKEKETVKPD